MKTFKIICLFLSISLILNNELIEKLKNQIHGTFNQMPGNYQSVVSNLRGSATADASYFQPAKFQSEMQRFGFKQDVVSKFQNIVWSSSVAFQTFTSSYINNHFEHEEFIGIGRNNNGLISIAFVKGNAQGDSQKSILKAQAIIQCNKCKSVPKFFMESCKSQHRCNFLESDYAVTQPEYYTIDQALRSYSLSRALEKLNTINGIENSLENLYKYEEQQRIHDEEQKLIKAQLEEYKQNCVTYFKSCPALIQEKCIFLECIKKDLSLTEKVLCNFKVEQCKSSLNEEQILEQHCKQCICLQNKVISKESIFDCL